MLLHSSVRSFYKRRFVSLSFRMSGTAIFSGASTVASAISLESANLSLTLSKATDVIDAGDLDVSPVTLSSAWSRVARLLLLVSLAVCGSVGNVFMISAVVVEDQLNKRGTSAVLSLRLRIKTATNAEPAHGGGESFSRAGVAINLRRKIKIAKATLERIRRVGGAGLDGELRLKRNALIDKCNDKSFYCIEVYSTKSHPGGRTFPTCLATTFFRIYRRGKISYLFLLLHGQKRPPSVSGRRGI